MNFTCNNEAVQCSIQQVVVAGWTGRNRDAVDHHIEELAQLGITPPSQVPLYYRVSNALLTQENQIQVLGSASSGEVEPLLIRQQDAWYLGLASDHTDRDLEAHSVAASKQACLKPVASELWLFDSVKDHLDEITMSCTMTENNEPVLYQEGSLANILPLQQLIDESLLPEHAALLCGTLGAIGGVRPALRYQMMLKDPVLNKSITLNYAVTELPVVN
ncbi:MAG: DUF2848 domain-containing protein [Granulosicoccus sp.]